MSLRRASAADRPLAWLWFAAAAASLALAPFGTLLAPLLPGCALREWTGWPCPTCGSTRAALALAGLRVGEALRLNPLVTVALLGFLAGGLAAPLWVALRAPLPVMPTRWPRSWKVALVGSMLANWAYLIASGV